jgi:hypothetical protein
MEGATALLGGHGCPQCPELNSNFCIVLNLRDH